MASVSTDDSNFEQPEPWESFVVIETEDRKIELENVVSSALSSREIMKKETKAESSCMHHNLCFESQGNIVTILVFLTVAFSFPK